MANKSTPNMTDTPTRVKKKNPLLIFVCVFLALATLFGATLGIISLVLDERAVVVYGGVRMNEGVASYFLSRYRVEYERALRAEGYDPDADGFWESEYKDGVSFAEHLKEGGYQHLRGIVAENYIFNTMRSLTGEEKDALATTAAEVLEYQAGGDEDEFNARAEKYGFDYGDFCDAVIMDYKASYSFEAMYGEGGISIASDSVVCGSYLNEYTHVSLLLLRESTRLENDENRYLTDSERAENAALLAKYDAAYEAYLTDSDGALTPTAFEKWLTESHDSGTDWITTGYYFHPSAAATAEFDSAVPGVVEAAYKLKMNSFGKITVKLPLTVDGEEIEETVHVFMYRYPPASGAYADSDMSEVWFSDFYSDAAVHFYNTNVTDVLQRVEQGGSFDDVDITKIATNVEFVPRG